MASLGSRLEDAVGASAGIIRCPNELRLACEELGDLTPRYQPIYGSAYTIDALGPVDAGFDPYGADDEDGYDGEDDE
jgi:hypothetical protein